MSIYLPDNERVRSSMEGTSVVDTQYVIFG
jgi:hypothetical protein